MSAPPERLRAVFAALLRAVLICTFCAPAAAAAGFAPGDSTITIQAGGGDLQLFVYKPANYRGEGLIVSLHGTTRNAADYRNYTRPLADRFRALLIVPYFDAERFPTWRYSYAGVSRRRPDGSGRDPMPPEQWTSESLRAIVEHARSVETSPNLPFVLIGHSAGGQFLSRVAAFTGLRPVRYILANPGTWVTPSMDEAFPFGFGGLPAEVSNQRTLERYLAQPLTALVGTADTRTDRHLPTLEGARRQGETRYPRALNVFHQAEATARSHAWRFGWSMVEVPGVAHNARLMYASPLAAKAFCPDQVPRATDTGPTPWPCNVPVDAPSDAANGSVRP